ncbi:MAG: hypothetical protein JWN86_2782 [Planctomycetota bacterium]|nr:hypothetical protein [Planctomycetota bacterium]
MVRRRLLFGAATLLALVGARPAAAGSISFMTGDVEKDMPSSSPDVVTIVNHPDSQAQTAIYQAPWITQNGWVNGRVIKDVRAFYDQSADKLYVGVNFFGIAGDVDGNGVVGTADPKFSGTEQAHLGLFSHSDTSIAVGIDLKNSGTPTIIAGIASDKSIIGPGTDGFTVNWAKDSTAGLSGQFGASLNATHNGNLAFEPSKAHPDFEFSIDHLSTIPGFSITNGIGISAFSGSSDDIDVGEDSVQMTHIALEQIPEPTTILGWSLVAAAAACGGAIRRKGGPSLA